jgi:putative NADH-flavin reductase
MKLLVIGASQGTGALVVQQALQRGHEVTAFARNPQRLISNDPKLHRMKGDFHQQQSVAPAVPGHDAVVITASGTSLKAFKESPAYFSRGTRHVIEAMKQYGVRRLVILSALGVGDSASLLNPVGALFIRLFFKEPFIDHALQERLARASGLEWAIARPHRLTNGPARHQFVKETALKRVPTSISRADVASFLLEAAETDAWIGKTVMLGG